MKHSWFKVLMVAALLSLACTTKVSEWILLNETAEKYVLVYFHSQPLSETEKLEQNELKERIKDANILFATEKRGDVNEAHYALYSRNELIAEFKDINALDKLVSSPLRKEVVHEIKSGKLCVMLYLKTGDTLKDSMGLEAINQTLKKSPFGNIITVVGLDRKSEEEKFFVSMLLGVEDDLKYINEPMLFGIFGRFRALEPLLAKGISEENINLMIDFLTADCSCLIKDNLPGKSILVGENWEKPQPALANAILDANPELIHK